MGYGFVKSTGNDDYYVTEKGKELLCDLDPMLEDQISAIVEKKPRISKSGILLSLTVIRLEQLRKKYNKEKQAEVSLTSIFGTITVRSDELKKALNN